MKRMSSHLMVEWMAYAQVEPFGDELLDVHMATIEAMFRNANRDKGDAVLEPDKFRLWNRETQSFDPQDFFDRLKTALKR